MSETRILAAFATLVLLTLAACVALAAVGWWPMGVALVWIVYAYGAPPFYRFLRWRGWR